MLHEVALAHAPIDEEVLGEEGRDDHAASVVHVAHVVDLAHRRVHDGKPGTTGAPGFELFHVVFPFDIGVFRLERFVHTGALLVTTNSKRSD